MGRLRSDQAKALRGKAVRSALLAFVVYTLAFSGVVLMLRDFSPVIGNAVADATSHWLYVSKETLSEHGETIDDNIQVLVEPNGQIAMRDLSTYYAVRNLKEPLLLALYVAGLAVIWFRSVSKTIGYVDRVSQALSVSCLIEGENVELPDELASTRVAVGAVRTRIAASELAVVNAEQRKNELVAYLAHDIKTPLTSVVGYLELLADAPELPDEKRRDYAARALAKTDRLEELMDEFFEITRYNLQAIPIERSTVDLLLFCEQVADEFALVAQERRQRIVVEAPADTPVFIDSAKMARAVGNVMRNALAYGDAGTVVRLQAGVAGAARVAEVAREVAEVAASACELGKGGATDGAGMRKGDAADKVDLRGGSTADEADAEAVGTADELDVERGGATGGAKDAGAVETAGELGAGRGNTAGEAVEEAVGTADEPGVEKGSATDGAGMRKGDAADKVDLRGGSTADEADADAVETAGELGAGRGGATGGAGAEAVGTADEPGAERGGATGGAGAEAVGTADEPGVEKGSATDGAGMERGSATDEAVADAVETAGELGAGKGGATGGADEEAVGTADELSSERGGATGGAKDAGALTIVVTNQGREISAAHLERIFEKFYREDVSRKQGKNAGLGLAIARDIVQAHRGSITAASENGTTTFTISLPQDPRRQIG